MNNKMQSIHEYKRRFNPDTHRWEYQRIFSGEGVFSNVKRFLKGVLKRCKKKQAMQL